jgi:DnaD/phage-associated family protein
VTRPFDGFSTEREKALLLPPELFTELLAEIQDVAELKVLLTVFRLVATQKDRPKEQLRVVSRDMLRNDPHLQQGLTGLGPEMTPIERLDRALERCVVRGTLLHRVVQRGGHAENLYLLNTAANRRRAAELEQATSLPEAPPAEVAEPAGIFRLYEQNIGLITPLLAEELTAAAQKYPAGWIEEAFREAVAHNRRAWRYIQRILERRERDARGQSSQIIDLQDEKYTTGKYAHLFRRERRSPGPLSPEVTDETD